MPSCWSTFYLKASRAAPFAPLLLLPLLLLLLLLLAGGATPQEFSSPWTYTCQGQGSQARCVKEEVGTDPALSLNFCKLTCGADGPLFPKTSQTATIGNEVSRFMVAQMTELISGPASIASLVSKNLDLFRMHLDMYHPDYNFSTGGAPWSPPSDPDIESHVLRVEVTVATDESRLSLTTDESYNLNIVPAPGVTTAVIIATTFFGARHGIETLSQLIDYDEINDCLQIVNSVVITNDTPAFPYRGIALDTSRNYIPIANIERTLDGMAANKLNTLHLHITDTHSFPFVMESLPNMHKYGAYSSRHLYTANEVRAIVEYGRVRGIRVLPEFDAPAHVGNGWQWGPQQGLGNLAVCVNQEPWASYCVEPPCGQLNIANENMYDILGQVYNEFVSAFEPLDLFHYGGDEVNLNCWNSTQEVQDWMLTVGDGTLTELAYVQQWSVFQNKAYDLLTTAKGGVEMPGIIWTSRLTEQGTADLYLDKNRYIIQIWTTGDDPLIAELLQKEYRVIFSNYDAWYFDCGFGAWVGEGNNWCSPYIGWQKVYDNDPLAMAGSPDYYSQVIGGEAALWTEQVDEKNLDSKLWPRGAALAERLWSNPEESWREAEWRMVHHRQRLVQRGLAAERLQPEWCRQNEGLCYL